MSALTDQQRLCADRVAMPSLGRISVAWMQLPTEELLATFPEHRGPGIGWSEPFCFRCGWLTPTRAEGFYVESKRNPTRTFELAWSAASGWLERAHLQDHRFGGGNGLLDIVPMCALCHEKQRLCETREQGIAYVNEGCDLPPQLHGLFQWSTDAHLRDKPLGRARGDAARRMTRVLAMVGVTFSAAAIEAGVLEPQ